MKVAQIELEDEVFEKLQIEAKQKNITISELINELITQHTKRPDFNAMVGIWSDKDIDIEDIRKRAWR
jgi:predicted CopG family antitoxin